MNVFKVEMASGEFMDPANPNPSKIHLSDIFQALSGEHRFNNQTSRPYTVLEHTINCVQLAALRGATTQQMIEVFTHDFEEAYTRDLSTPFKHVVPQFVEIAERWSEAIDVRFGIIRANAAYTKEIDRDMLVLEGNILMPSKAIGYSHLSSGKSIDKQIVDNVEGPKPSVDTLRTAFYYYTNFLGLN